MDLQAFTLSSFAIILMYSQKEEKEKTWGQ